jgi:hypothetical protein
MAVIQRHCTPLNGDYGILGSVQPSPQKGVRHVESIEARCNRLTQMAQEKVVDKKVIAEAQGQLDSSTAAWDAAQAAVAA